MSIVDDAFEQRVGDAAAAEIVVPGFDRQLRCDHGGASAIPFFREFDQVLLFVFGEGRKAEVVDLC